MGAKAFEGGAAWWFSRWVILFSILSILCTSGAEKSLAAAKGASKKTGPPVLLWSDSQPGCTFSTTEDGKYSYSISSSDVTVVVAVNAREVQIIRHRIEPIFGILLTIRYKGDTTLDYDPGGATLQFMKHFKVVQPALDPDDYTDKIQADADMVDEETRRIEEKHPDKKDVRETREQEYQKSIAELIEFITRKTLRAGRLDRGKTEASGWVFFNTKNKWLGGWKAQEEFVLRLPVEGKVFEFPFKLPPKKGELLMRKRE
jgi:soluble cytochrome b562